MTTSIDFLPCTGLCVGLHFLSLAFLNRLINDIFECFSGKQIRLFLAFKKTSEVAIDVYKV